MQRVGICWIELTPGSPQRKMKDSVIAPQNVIGSRVIGSKLTGEEGTLMSRFPLKLYLLLAATTFMMGSCTGGGPRQLQSLSVSPVTASANGTPVQFTATGHWSLSPIAVTPQDATWGACTTANVPTTDVTVSSAGLATCGTAAKGTYNVYAWDPQYGFTGPTCNAISVCGPGCGRVSATVQITCPLMIAAALY